MSELPEYIWRATQRTFQYKDEARQSFQQISNTQTVCTEYLPHAKARSGGGCHLRPFEAPLGSVTAFPDGSPIRNPTGNGKEFWDTPVLVDTFKRCCLLLMIFVSWSHRVFSLSMKKGQQMRYHSEKTAAPILCWPLHEGGGAPHWSYILFLKQASLDVAWGLGAGQDEALAWMDQAGGSLSGVTPSVKHAPAASRGIAGGQRTTASAHPTSFWGASSRLQRSQSCSSSVFLWLRPSSQQAKFLPCRLTGQEEWSQKAGTVWTCPCDSGKEAEGEWRGWARSAGSPLGTDTPAPKASISSLPCFTASSPQLRSRSRGGYSSPGTLVPPSLLPAAPTRCPPSPLTSQVGFSAMPPHSQTSGAQTNRWQHFEQMLYWFKESNSSATKLSSHICKCASTHKAASHSMTVFCQGTQSTWNPFCPHHTSLKVGEFSSVQQVWKLRFTVSERLAILSQSLPVTPSFTARDRSPCQPRPSHGLTAPSFTRKEQRIQVVGWNTVHLNGKISQ